MARKKKSSPSRRRSAKIPPPPPPTETELRFQARFAEALSYLIGDEAEDVCPTWVRRAGAECLRWLPAEMVESARGHPREYLGGFQAGITLAGVEMLLTMPAKQVQGFNRWHQIMLPRAFREQPGYSAGVERVFRRFDIRAVPSLVRREIARKLKLKSSERVAFFEGFAFGLSPMKNFGRLDTHLKSVAKAGERADRSGIRRFLWLHWPEVEAAENRRVVYEMCKASFAAVGDTHSVGAWSAFDKFCQREGIKGPMKRKP